MITMRSILLRLVNKNRSIFILIKLSLKLTIVKITNIKLTVIKLISKQIKNNIYSSITHLRSSLKPGRVFNNLKKLKLIQLILLITLTGTFFSAKALPPDDVEGGVLDTPPWIETLGLRIWDANKTEITDQIEALEPGWYLDVPTAIQTNPPLYVLKDLDDVDSQDDIETVDLYWYLLRLKAGQTWPSAQQGDYSHIWRGTLATGYQSELFSLTPITQTQTPFTGSKSNPLRIPLDLTYDDDTRIGVVILPRTAPSSPGIGYELHIWDMSKLWGQPPAELGDILEENIDNQSLIIGDHPVIQSPKINPVLPPGEVRVTILDSSGQDVLKTAQPLYVLNNYRAKIEIKEPDGRIRMLNKEEFDASPFTWNLYFNKQPDNPNCQFNAGEVTEDNDCFIKESFTAISDPNRVNNQISNDLLEFSQFKMQDLNKNAKERLRTIPPNFSEQGYFLTVSFAYQKSNQEVNK